MFGLIYVKLLATARARKKAIILPYSMIEDGAAGEYDTPINTIETIFTETYK